MRSFRCAAAWLCLLSLAGCTAFAPREVVWIDSTVQLAWPSPPDPPRIRYLRSVGSPAEVHKEWAERSGILQWLTGERPEFYTMVSPYGIAADGEGRIWVADMGIRGVHCFDLATRKADYIFAAGDESLASPVGVAVDPEAGRLYVSDSVLATVFVYTLAGRFLEKWQPDDGFGRPGGMTVDRQGHLYVVDVTKNRVTVFTRQGEAIRQVVGQSAPTYAFHAPSNVAVDAANRLYVSDTMQFRVEIFDAEGKTLGIVGKLGAGAGSFSRPRGVAVDGDGHLYVVDAAFGNVQVFDDTGRLLTYFGANGEKPGQFSLPAGLVVDRNNRIYVVDAHNLRVQIFQYLDGKAALPLSAPN